MLLGICGHIPPSALLLPTVLFAKHSSSGRAGPGVRHRKLETTQGAPTRKDPRPQPVRRRFKRLPIPETQSLPGSSSHVRHAPVSSHQASETANIMYDCKYIIFGHGPRWYLRTKGILDHIPSPANPVFSLMFQ